MRIDKAGQHHAASTIDLDDLLAVALQPTIADRILRGPGRDDLPTDAENGSIFNNSQVGKIASTAGTWRRTAQRHELADIDEEDWLRFRHFR